MSPGSKVRPCWRNQVKIKKKMQLVWHGSWNRQCHILVLIGHQTHFPWFYSSSIEIFDLIACCQRKKSGWFFDKRLKSSKMGATDKCEKLSRLERDSYQPIWRCGLAVSFQPQSKWWNRFLWRKASSRFYLWKSVSGFQMKERKQRDTRLHRLPVEECQVERDVGS